MEKQEVWDVDIFTNLSKVLVEARREILVATAWFTDKDLFQILLQKVEEGLSVMIVISEHEDNKRLDFKHLESLGAKVAIIPKNGRGMMHDKFCIIDSKISVSGSYNWTHNARMNNSESVIYTQDSNTVNTFRDKFFKMIKSGEAVVESRIEGRKKDGLFSSLIKPFKSNKEAVEGVLKDANIANLNGNAQQPKEDFESNLDSIISSEASDFDREILNDRGYKLAKKNNGDHKIILEALDSIYSVFVYEIDVVEEKKKKLIAKINEYRVKAIDLLKSKALIKSNAIETNCLADKEEVNRKIDGIKIDFDSNVKTILDMNDVRKVQKNAKIDALKEEILEHEIEFEKPSINKIDFFTNLSISFGLLVYLFFFYSSAGYILLYSVQDAKAAEFDSAKEVIQEVFNSDAIYKAYDRGFASIVFILLFVFIPVGCAIYSSSIKGKEDSIKFNFLSKLYNDCGYYVKKFFLIVILDGFIAFKVAKAIHESKYLSGDISDKWDFTKVIYSVDFYLVFVLGTVAIFLFGVFFSKVKEELEARNADVERGKKNLIISQKNIKISEFVDKINVLDIEKSDIEKKNIELNNNLEKLQRELIYIPSKKDAIQKEIEANLNVEINSIDNKTEIYISNIENDKFPISVDSLKDRISVFLEGWNEWLHAEFAVEKAKQLSEKARTEAVEWRKTKITSGLNSNIINN